MKCIFDFQSTQKTTEKCYLILVILILFLSLKSTNSFAQAITIIKKNKREQLIAPSVQSVEAVAVKTKKTKKKLIKQTVSVVNSSVEKEDGKIAEVDAKNASLVKNFFKSAQMGITDDTSSFDVLSGTVVHGRVLNSIVSSNLESPVIVEVTSSKSDIPVGARFICSCVTKNKRIITACTKLITNNDEYQVNVSLLNVDGTAGLIGEVYTGKEEFIMGGLASAFLRSSLDVSQDRIATVTGDMVKNTQKNKVLGGTIGALDEGIQAMNEEMRTKETKISVDAGAEVLIFFNSRFKQ